MPKYNLVVQHKSSKKIMHNKYKKKIKKNRKEQTIFIYVLAPRYLGEREEELRGDNLL
jgi:hypothetical protein